MRKSCHTATRTGHTTSNSFLVPLCRRSSLLWMTNTTCEACSSQSAGHCSTHSCVCSSSTSLILFLWLLILMPGLEFLPKQAESHSGPVRDHSEAGPFKGGLQVCVIAAASLGCCCCSCQYFNTVDSNQSVFESPLSSLGVHTITFLAFSSVSCTYLSPRHVTETLCLSHASVFSRTSSCSTELNNNPLCEELYLVSL